MPQSTAVAGTRPLASEQPTAERMARIAAQLATQFMPLARLALSRVRTGSGVRPEGVEDAEGAPQSGVARTTAAVARVVNAVGATFYDYSNGQYGIKPVDVKALRHARKEAEKEAEARRHDQAPARRGGAKWVLLGLGALAVGGAVAAVVILQREQLRAAATEVLDRGRQTVEQTRHQFQARGSITP